MAFGSGGAGLEHLLEALASEWILTSRLHLWLGIPPFPGRTETWEAADWPGDEAQDPVREEKALGH